jgi:hypothetical protein
VPNFTLDKRAGARSYDRYGDLPLGAVIRTDERYGKDPIFQGPRGWDYWNRLENPKPSQDPNLWPDKRPTYFLAQLELPSGTDLTVRSRFPHARYFKLALYRFEHDTFVSLGNDLAAWDIEPDPGSANPYGLGADRTVENRNFTVHIVTADRPANPAKNTVYAGKDPGVIQAVVRVYMSDEGYDGAGLGPADSPSLLGPAFECEAILADGTRLSAEEIVKRFARPLGSAPPPMNADQWYALVDSKENDPSLDPTSAPAGKGRAVRDLLRNEIHGSGRVHDARGSGEDQTPDGDGGRWGPNHCLYGQLSLAEVRPGLRLPGQAADVPQHI